jgi:alpha-tubulin suppressor-like RCC1 family protein
MKNKFLLSLIFSFFLTQLSAQDYYWVNNGGDWSDYETHWATSSGGSVMHESAPGPNDRVYFDENSFTEASQMVSIDTDEISCAVMNWENVSNLPEFYGGTDRKIIIHESMVLADKNSMRLSIFGALEFSQTLSGEILSFDPKDHTIQADISISVNNGRLNILNHLNMKQKNLLLNDGELNLNGNNLSVMHFNADEDLSLPAPVTNPKLSNIDSLFCYGSLHLVDALDLTDFSAYISLAARTLDSGYVNTANHILNSEIVFTSNKKYFLQSHLETTKGIALPMSGEFHSQDYNISAKRLESTNSLNRTLDFGSSVITVSELAFNSMGLNIISGNADLIFSGTGDLIFYTDKSDLIFKNISINSTGTLYWDGEIQSENLNLVAGSKLLLDGGSVLEFNNLSADGDCGNYIELRANCSNDENCVNILPVLRSANPVTASYLKLSYIEADGDFTANNSYDEGGNTGWTINEPTAANTLYWVGGTGNWNTSGNWASTSGGTPQTCIPTASTDVVFDQNSFSGDNTVSLEEYGYCASVSWENLTNSPTFSGEGSLFTHGDISLHANLNADFSGNLYLENNSSTYTVTVETNGAEINAPITINGTGSHDFIDPAVINNSLTLNTGTLSFSGNQLNVNALISDNTNTRSLDIRNTVIKLNGDKDVWLLNADNLNFQAAGSDIAVQGSGSDKKFFHGGNLDYGHFAAVSGSVKINGSNRFETLNIEAGNTLELESGSLTEFTSLTENASCSEPIALVSEVSDFPATIKNTGAGQVLVNYFFIKNITADVTGGKTYKADASTAQGDYSGWDFTNTAAGKVFYWLGNTSNWHELSNWQVDGSPATCLPTSADAVIVDPTDFDAAASQTIEITQNAYCASFTASGLNQNLNVSLSQNLYVSSAFETDANVTFNYAEAPTYSNLSDYNYGIYLIPDGTDLSFDPHNSAMNVNICVNPANLTDAVIQNPGSNLITNEYASLSIMSGTYSVTTTSVIECGFFKSETDAEKIINIEDINIKVANDIILQSPTLLSFNANGSHIEFIGNNANFSELDGAGQTLHNVSVYGNTGENADNLIYFLKGSNTFNNLSIYDGVTIFAEAGKTQAVNNNFLIEGTCQNYVNLNSSQTGSVSSFNNVPTSSDITCVIAEDISVTDGTEAVLSFDEGNNTGWIFDTTKAAVASYTLPDPACIDQALTFTNNSVSMDGGTTNLSFEWFTEGTSVSTDQDLIETFNASGDYSVTLKATHTVTGCSDEQTQTLTLEEHTALLSSDVSGNEICQGETVTFTASSDKATEYAFYLNGTYTDLGDPAQNTYTTSSLQNNDEIYVETLYNGCVQTSNTEIFTVNPVPTVSLSGSDADNIICDGEFISFTATGADEYQFLKNGLSIGSFSETNTYESSELTDQTLISVKGKNADGCISEAPEQYTITVLPNPTVELISTPDPATICSGDNMAFETSGANTYEFFINGISQTSLSTQNTFETSELQNSDVITATGYDTEGCYSTSNSVQVIVNPSPEPVLSSDAENNEICLGETVNFTASGATEYEFFIDGVSQGAFDTNNTYTTDALTDGQTVALRGRSGSCVRDAESIQFSVFPVIELQASTTEICAGETITFTASGDDVYQFFVDGQAVTALEANPTFESSALEDGQTVSVEGTPGACLPDPIEITVRPLPVASLSSSEPNATICQCDMITFSASGGSEYEFFVDGISQGPASANSKFSSENMSNGETVSVLAYSNYGCSAFSGDELTVTVNPYPTVSLASSETNTEICEGESINFTASGANEYQFFISGEAQGDFSAANEFIAEDLSGNPEISVLGRSDKCVSEAPETYSYTVFNLPNVRLNAVSAVSVCEDDLISLQAQGAVEYEFFVNSVSQGSPSTNDIFESTTLSDADEITVTGYQNICSSPSSDTIIVDINQVPVLEFSSNIGSEGLCEGEPAEFSVSGAMSYQFYLDGYPLGDMTSDGFISIPEPEDQQRITVTGFNNACFAQANDTIQIDVNYVNLNLGVLEGQYSLCAGESRTVYAEGADRYEFFLNGNSLGTAGTESSALVENISQGDYIYVTAQDLSTNCQKTSANYYFEVRNIPQISALPSTDFCEGDSAELIADGTQGIQWYYNSETIPGANADSYIAYEGGTYFLTTSTGSQGQVFSSGANAYGQLGDGSDRQHLEKTQAIIEAEITEISSGSNFAAAVDSEGNVYVWGNNDWGNLGTGNYSPVYTPVMLESVSGVSQIKTGSQHALAVKTDGSVFSWGRNTYGQLGYGNHSSSNFPVQISSLANITSVAAGEKHSLALSQDGKIYAWGDNSFGQIGDGTFEERSEPVLIDGPDNAVFITAGSYHSMAVDSEGKVWTWGRNENGQLGIGDYNASKIPVQNRELYHITQVAAGAQHSLALNNRGEVYAWGNNADGQVGIAGISSALKPQKTDVDAVKNIACGLYSSYIVRADGSLWSWGLNNSGQLGNETTVTTYKPTKADQFSDVKAVSAGKDFMNVIWGQGLSCTSNEITLTTKSVPEVSIERNGMTLSTIEGESYQWFFNESPLSNTNSQSITASAVGEYTVEVTFSNGCSALSDIYSFSLDSKDLFSQNYAQIYPNPNKGSFELTLDMPEAALKSFEAYRLVSISGAVIAKENNFVARKTQALKFETLPAGVYYLTLLSNEGNITLKVFIAE